MSEVRELVASELSLPIDPRVSAMAAAIAAAHGAASRAVLFYGSCLREQRLDGLMLDFYLIVSDYRAAYRKRWLALANRLIPPNVFHFEHDGLAAKYAVLSEADFRRLNGPETSSVSVWARFAQPSRLVWAADERSARVRVRRGGARRTDSARRGGIAGRRSAARPLAARLRADLFGRAARRAEGQGHVGGRPGARPIRALQRPRFCGNPRGAAHQPSWGWRRIEGKALSVAAPRQGGAYLLRGRRLYRVEDQPACRRRRSRLKPWQRRHPLLAGISLLPRLLKSGAVR